MRARTITVAALVLAVTGHAQNYVYSPAPQYQSHEGVRLSSLLGTYPAGRYQLADATLRGAAVALKEIAMRPDGLSRYDQRTGMGRRWSNVRLRMGETDVAKMTSQFTANMLTTPTTVFAGTMNWPTLSGAPATVPTPWSIRFPFASSWTYQGTRDVLADFTFFGGTLANNAGWGSTSSINYYLDTFTTGSYTGGAELRLGDGDAYGKGCWDSASSKFGAYLNLKTFHYGPHYYNVSQRNGMRAAFWGYRFGNNASVLTFLGGRAIAAGWTFPGVTCNKGYVDFALPVIQFAGTTNPVGRLAEVNLPGPSSSQVIPADPKLLAVDFVLQSAWSDTQFGDVKLSAAVRTTMPPLPPFRSWSNSRRVVYQQAPGASIYGPDNAPQNNPILRYAK